MFKTQLVPVMKDGMFVKYVKGTREDCLKVQIECLESEYLEHEKRMSEIKEEITALKEELNCGNQK